MSGANVIVAVAILLTGALACNASAPRETDESIDAADVDVGDGVDANDTGDDSDPSEPTACDDHPDIWPTVLDPCDCRGTSYRRYIERFDSDGQFLGGCTMQASCAAGSWGTAWIIFDYCESDAG